MTFDCQLEQITRVYRNRHANRGQDDVLSERGKVKIFSNVAHHEENWTEYQANAVGKMACNDGGRASGSLLMYSMPPPLFSLHKATSRQQKHAAAKLIHHPDVLPREFSKKVDCWNGAPDTRVCRAGRPRIAGRRAKKNFETGTRYLRLRQSAAGEKQSRAVTIPAANNGPKGMRFCSFGRKPRMALASEVVNLVGREFLQQPAESGRIVESSSWRVRVFP